MKFGNLHYLYLLWIVPAMILLAVYSFRKKASLIRLFCGSHLWERLTPGVQRKKQKFRVCILLVAVFLILFALLQPRWGFHWEEVTRKGVDIMVAMDVSESMRARDVTPDRLERAKREIADLVQMLKGDRIGLVAFAGVSFLQCPLTLDYGAFKLFLDCLDTDLIPVPGTALADAIRMSIKAFAPNRRTSRALILISDGEDHQGDTEKAAEEAKKNGIRIFAIGIGSESGAPIPLRDNGGGFKKDSKGQMILTKLDETGLQKIALATGGSYVRSVTGDMDLKKIYEEQIQEKMEATELNTSMRRRWEERFQWFLFAGILLLFIESMLGEHTRSGKTIRFKWVTSLRRTLPSIIVFSCIISVTFHAQAESGRGKLKKAAALYDAQQYDEALQQFLDAQIELPEDPGLKYNVGNTYYRMGNYQEAEKAFWGSATSGDPALEQHAFYNLGNCAYRQGKLDEAVAHYKKAVELDPHDEDAQANLEFVQEEIKRRIEEAKKREEEQKSSEQQKDSSQSTSCPNPSPSQGREDSQTDQSKGSEERTQEQTAAQPSDSPGSAGEAVQEPPSQEGSDGRNTPTGYAQGMSPEEAERWLNTLSEEQKDLLKKQAQKLHGQRRLPDKDW